MKTPLRLVGHDRGFTLVELLTVVAIVGVLAAISIPLVGRMRESSRTSMCASNLRQLGATLLLYAADHKGQLPHYTTHPGGQGSTVGEYNWMQALLKAGYLQGEQNRDYGFAGGVWACPTADPTLPGNGTQINHHTGGLGVLRGVFVNDYDTNRFGSRGTARLNQVPSPAKTWLVGDASADNNPLSKALFTYAPRQGSGYAGVTNQQPAPRHRDRVNVCHFDGHIATYDMTTLGDITAGPFPFTF